MTNSIPLSQLQECHLLNYESHIISVVLSHCHHSLEVGKGTDVQYDFRALEKKIVERFIQGKPLIQFENAPRVMYRKDVHNVQKFMDVRQKVPQVRNSTYFVLHTYKCSYMYAYIIITVTHTTTTTITGWYSFGETEKHIG